LGAGRVADKLDPPTKKSCAKGDGSEEGDGVSGSDSCSVSPMIATGRTHAAGGGRGAGGPGEKEEKELRRLKPIVRGKPTSEKMGFGFGQPLQGRIKARARKVAGGEKAEKGGGFWGAKV